ncbi:M67 family metallopeptidase [Phormidium pseudopriestleyi FRX01]|uniref:M67 family metallopeptidase n=1 Tax=Phormidium pseudopriestleyi FRX01 TaxID=1759528 RepID=A0ABS3FVL3_9CYAN|nr:M67 family metallopeptidase [Phormidium pseudopriestleyi]MBO0350897.1 M67 family metallopeptidase [Phormidium pseudopriestleyi FRX01]
MILTVTATHEATIRTHAERTYPEECCGLLLGEISPTGKTVVEVWETENVWSPETARELSDSDTLTKERRYVIHPKELLRAQKQGRDRQLRIVGIYHSHPNYPAIPSECDREYAWSEYSYIIVAVEQGQATQLTNWTLDQTHHFQPEPLVIATAES